MRRVSKPGKHATVALPPAFNAAPARTCARKASTSSSCSRMPPTSTSRAGEKDRYQIPAQRAGPRLRCSSQVGPCFCSLWHKWNLVPVLIFPVSKTLKTRSGVTSELTTVQVNFSFAALTLKRFENSIFSSRFPLRWRNTSAVPVVYAYS